VVSCTKDVLTEPEGSRTPSSYWKDDTKTRKHYQENRLRILEYKRKHYQENRARILAAVKQYREKNRARIGEYKREYSLKKHVERQPPPAQNNREKRLQYKRDYHQQNRDKRLLVMRKYHQENREKRLQDMAEYRLKNQAKIKQLQREILCQKKEEHGLPPPRKYSSWKSVNEVRRFFLEVAELYHIQNWPEDWYRISVGQVHLAGGVFSLAQHPHPPN
jgi:hypothetical protein